MTITERHALQQDIAINHVLAQRNRQAPSEVRRLMAYWMKQVRKLPDGKLVRIAATL